MTDDEKITEEPPEFGLEVGVDPKKERVVLVFTMPDKKAVLYVEPREAANYAMQIVTAAKMLDEQARKKAPRVIVPKDAKSVIPFPSIHG